MAEERHNFCIRLTASELELIRKAAAQENLLTPGVTVTISSYMRRAALREANSRIQNPTPLKAGEK